MTITDTGQVKLLKEVLAASERRFRSVFDSGFQFVLLLDDAGCVLEMNRAARRAFHTPDSLVGSVKAWECMWWSTHPAASARLRAAIERAAIPARVHYDEEFPVAGGGTVVLEIAVSRMADAGGIADQYVVEARDVTSRRRADLAGREIETLATVGRIAAKVAHEINNPLAGIQYAFLLIKDAIPPSHPQHKYVGAIEREIARIATVTRQLYETYRPESGDGSDTSLANVIGDVIAFARQVNPNSGVRIDSDLTAAPALVRVSGAVLRHAVYTLVQNAMDVSPEGTSVTVTAVDVDGDLEIRVADSSQGLSEDLRDQMFERSLSTEDAGGLNGVSLGLSLVRRSVFSAGGTIRVDANPGGGATFVVTLPYQAGT